MMSTMATSEHEIMTRFDILLVDLKPLPKESFATEKKYLPRGQTLQQLFTLFSPLDSSTAKCLSFAKHCLSILICTDHYFVNQ